jgi:hypothetical protein
MNKNTAKNLQRDFIPNGQKVEINSLRFRKTTEEEVYQCCANIDYDSQSGPLYCGKVADFLAESGEGSYLALCERHRPPARLVEEKSITIVIDDIELILPPSS